ncbi:hypothetical protein PGT21_009083 [Puccinia graminis f. sp. tritici]|uniref:Uncharacterized protein n=1 Tax=Puccinia graminis f. sp. tritici TaxID=56615 RepID=A0A5B0PKQ6_PUCGR|nr:hypothetical protein PGT21_009083 [Puccinia graminis f. sp. tritici]
MGQPKLVWHNDTWSLSPADRDRSLSDLTGRRDWHISARAQRAAGQDPSPDYVEVQIIGGNSGRA